MRSRIEPMTKVARTIRAHRELILNYFRARKEFSSGVIEGLNNKAKVTIGRSYGFRTFRVTELALYHSLGKLPKPELTPSGIIIFMDSKVPSTGDVRVLAILENTGDYGKLAATSRRQADSSGRR
jgi:hypothetical protein